MRQFFWIPLLLAVALIPVAARAQLDWKVTREPIVNDTEFFVESLSCSGNNCTASGFFDPPNTALRTIIFYHSTDAGRTWTIQNPGLPPEFTLGSGLEIIVLDQIDSLNVVGIGDTGLIIRTTDAGASWYIQPSPVSGNFKDVSFCDSLNGIIVGGAGVITTSDGGAHWNKAPNFGSAFMSACHAEAPHQFRTMEYDYATVWCTTDDFAHVDSTAGIFHSQIDNGKNWALTSWVVGTGADSGTIEAYGGSFIQKIDSVAGRLDTYYVDLPLIARSSDCGANWYGVFEDTNEGDAEVNCISSINYDTVIAGPFEGRFNTIYLSTDKGHTWNPEPLIFTDTVNNYGSMIVYGISRLPSGDFMGAFSTSQAEAASFLMRSMVSTASVALQKSSGNSSGCYPNPASFTIAITSSEAGSTVHVLDILGREVLHGVMPASGSLVLDVSALPSGLYYITDGSVRSKFVKE